MRRVLKWIGIGLGGLIVIGVVLAGGGMLFGHNKLNRTYPLPPVAALRTDDPALIARGEHVAAIHGCSGCHGPDLGGAAFADIAPAHIIAPNLTRGRGGVASHYQTDQDWDRAVRHGLRPSGQALLPMMPAATFSRMADNDMAALIAFVKQVPPVDRQLAPTRIHALGYLMVAAMPMGEQPAAPPANRVTEPEPTAAYGAYLASSTCVECHGEHLAGADKQGPPQGPSLAGAAHWSLAEFSTAVRQGRVPGGRQLSEEMPYKHFAHLTDVEVEALHRYLGSLFVAAH
jgi:mono/diheme cytochrome c family protein